MATLNPLEQKARSSFIKGIILTTIVAVVIVALLGMQIYNLKKAEKIRVGNLVKVLVVSQNIYSGQIIDSDLFKEAMIDKALAPSGAITAASEFSAVAAMDDKGNEISTNTNIYGDILTPEEMDIQLNEYILHIKSADNAKTESVDEGAHQLLLDTSVNEYYYEVGPNGERITTHYFVGDNERKIDNATFAKKGSSQVTETKVIHFAEEDNPDTREEEGVYQLQSLPNGQYSYTRGGQVVTMNINRQYITLSDDSCISKIDLNANTILIPSMLAKNYEVTTDDLREEEYNMILLPTTLQSEETIDIRLQLPNGENYIVVSKKRVSIPQLGDSLAPSTIKIKLNEAELLTMSSAIVDAYKMTGAKLYAVKYVEPGLQGTATVTYAPSDETINLIQRDPNVVQRAREELYKFYGSDYRGIRDQINKSVNAEDADTRKTNVEGKISTEISTQKSERQQYLQSIEE